MKIEKFPDTDNTGMQQQIGDMQQFIASHGDMQLLLDRSASWADSRNLALKKSHAMAWRVVGGMAGLTVIAFVITGAIVAKSYQPAPQPLVLVVDRVTGKVEPLISLAEFQMTPEESTIRRDISTFLRALKNYTYDTAADNYLDAAAFMDAPGQAQWAAYSDTDNPKSPTMVYKKDGKVRIDIGAITINHDNNDRPISVRASFTETVKRGDMQVGPTTAWIASCPFRYVKASAKERDRRVNPLGIIFSDCQFDVDVGMAAGFLSAPSPSVAPVMPAAPAPALIVPSTTAPEAP